MRNWHSPHCCWRPKYQLNLQVFIVWWMFIFVWYKMVWKWTHLWHYLQKCTSENNFILVFGIIISAFWGYFCCYIKLKYILRYGKFTRLQKFSLLKIEEMSEISAQCITGIYVTYVTITMATAAILDSWKYKKMYIVKLNKNIVVLKLLYKR
jgi:hypothetical protein